jgi:hypothetical protein
VDVRTFASDELWDDGRTGAAREVGTNAERHRGIAVRALSKATSCTPTWWSASGRNDIGRRGSPQIDVIHCAYTLHPAAVARVTHRPVVRSETSSRWALW